MNHRTLLCFAGSIISTKITSVSAASSEIIMDHIYVNYIHSDVYLNLIRDQLLPDISYQNLWSKYQGLWTDDYFERAIGGSLAPLPDRPEAISTPYVNPAYTPNIPLDDYIASPSVAGQLRYLLELGFSLTAKWPQDHQNTNLMAYYLLTDLEQRSVCDSLDCRVFRKIVQQFHYRFTIMMMNKAGPAEPPNKFDVLLPMDLMESVVKLLEKRTQNLLVSTTSQVRLPTTAGGCWSRFFACPWIRRQPTTPPTTTTTTTTPIYENPAWIERTRANDKVFLSNFINDTNNRLDKILVELGSIIGGGGEEFRFEDKVQVMRLFIIHQLMSVMKGFMVNVGPTLIGQSNYLFHIILELYEKIFSSSVSQDDFPIIFDMIRETVFSIRLLLPDLQP